MFKKGQHYAALSVEMSDLKYLELVPVARGFRVVKSAKVPLEEGIIAQGRIVSMDRLSSAVAGLKAGVGGKFAPSLAVGLPPQDAVVRIVEMPKMSMEDARSAFGWDFESYFSFPLKEASYDIVPVEVPSSLSEDNMSVMVAAARLSVINGILDIMAKENTRVSAIEPIGIAIVRGITGTHDENPNGSVILSVGETSSQIILEYKGNGLVYRTVFVGSKSQTSEGASAYGLLMQEVRNSIIFGSSQFRGYVVKELILCGECCDDKELQATVQSELDDYRCFLGDPWDEWAIEGDLPDNPNGWEAAVGLAVRDAS